MSSWGVYRLMAIKSGRYISWCFSSYWCRTRMYFPLGMRLHRNAFSLHRHSRPPSCSTPAQLSSSSTPWAVRISSYLISCIRCSSSHWWDRNSRCSMCISFIVCLRSKICQSFPTAGFFLLSPGISSFGWSQYEGSALVLGFHRACSQFLQICQHEPL